MSHVFISYSRNDIDFALGVKDRIEKAGLAVWLDTNAIAAGADWSDAIDEAITDAVAVVLVMSPEAKASEYTAFEWAYALGAGVRVVTLMYRPVELHPRLSRLQYLDFTQPSARPWAEFLAQLDLAESASSHRARKLPSDAPQSVRQAFATLDSPEYKPRRQAISALASSSHPTAQLALEFALEHSLSDVRAQAAESLAEQGNIRAIPVLVQLLDDNNWGEDVIDSLIDFGAPAIDELMALLNDSAKSFLPRHLAAVTLASFENDAARSGAKGWTRWTFKETERGDVRPTSRGVSIYSDLGYRQSVRTAKAEMQRSGGPGFAVPELQRLHAGGAIRHWPNAIKAAKAESVHAIAIPLWIETPDIPRVELNIAFAEKAELSGDEIKILCDGPRRAPRKRAKTPKKN
ncbi:MAG TPA: toll/interleukin-1 receptor domain-containing protein [Pyrinomonadaceae bacterium]|nr:toll/interleukin-1 receptor domain-containing protein [Pyrinomonadaceae bacterium]